MTLNLNFSRRPVFPVNTTTTTSEENLVSSVWIANGYVMEGISEKNGDSYAKPCHFNWEFDHHYFESSVGGGGRGGGGGAESSTSTIDILDRLPSDPFGMNITDTFTAAITGLLEDFETDGLNLIWNGGAVKVQADLGFDDDDERFINNHHHQSNGGGFNGWIMEVKESEDVGNPSVSNAEEEFLSFGDEDTRRRPGTGTGTGTGTHHETNKAASSAVSTSTTCCSAAEDGGFPHEGLLYALNYLGAHDLLSVEMVCKSLRCAVQSDTLLWRNIHIDQKLSEKITDDALLRLAKRAQGNLQCLSLVECSRITDDGLKHVLECNPRITKLNVPGCTRLTVEGIIHNLKTFKVSGTPGIKQLRIGGRYGVTQMHFEELKSLVGANKLIDTNPHKPRFFSKGQVPLPYDDDRAIDIEMCPKCQNLRLVYDCPAESCQGKQSESQLCRGCAICIQRCSKCGRCINNSEYEETFSLDFNCSDCKEPLLPYQEGQDGNDGFSNDNIFHHETRYQLSLYG